MQAGHPFAAGPVDAPRVVRQRRIRAGALGLAVLLVALGGVLAGMAFVAAARTQECLAVTRAVSAGTALSAADLTVVEVTVPPGLTPVPAGDLPQVLGKRAAVSLTQGSLLTAGQVTDQSLVGSGRYQVGVGLPPDRVPARTLHPGDEVVLVTTADQSPVTAAHTNGQQDQVEVAEKFDATVVDVGPLGVDNTVVVYLAVRELEAPRVVALAAQDRIAMILRAVR